MATPFAQKMRLPVRSRPAEPLKKCDPRLWSNGSVLCDKFLVFGTCSREKCPYEHRKRSQSHRDPPPYCYNHYGLKGGCTRSPECPLVHGTHSIPDYVRPGKARPQAMDSSDDEDGGTVVDVEELRPPAAAGSKRARCATLRAEPEARWSEEECAIATVEAEPRLVRPAKSTESPASESRRDGSSTASASQRPLKTAQAEHSESKTALSSETLRPELAIYTTPGRRRSSHHTTHPATLATPPPEPTGPSHEGPSVYYPESVRSNSPTEGRKAPRRKRGEVKSDSKDDQPMAPAKAAKEPVEAEPPKESKQNHSKRRRRDIEKGAPVVEGVPVEVESVQTKQLVDPGNSRPSIFGPVGGDCVNALVDEPKETPQKQKRQEKPADTVPGMSSAEKANTRRGKEKIESFIQSKGVALGVVLGESVVEHRKQVLPDHPPSTTHSHPNIQGQANTTSTPSTTSSAFNENYSPPPPSQSPIYLLAAQLSTPRALHSPTSEHHKSPLDPLSLIPSSFVDYSIAVNPTLALSPQAPTETTVLSEVTFVQQFEEIGKARQKILEHKRRSTDSDIHPKTSPEALDIRISSPVQHRSRAVSLDSVISNECAGLNCCRPPIMSPMPEPTRGPKEVPTAANTMVDAPPVETSSPVTIAPVPVRIHPTIASMVFDPRAHPAMANWKERYCFNCWVPGHLPTACTARHEFTFFREQHRWGKGILCLGWTKLASHGHMGLDLRVTNDHRLLFQVMELRRRVSPDEFRQLLMRLVNPRLPENQSWSGLVVSVSVAGDSDKAFIASSRFPTPSTVASHNGGALLSPPDSRSTTPSSVEARKPSTSESGPSRSPSPETQPSTPTSNRSGNGPLTPESEKKERLPDRWGLIPGPTIQPVVNDWCRCKPQVTTPGHRCPDWERATPYNVGSLFGSRTQVRTFHPPEPVTPPPAPPRNVANFPLLNGNVLTVVENEQLRPPPVAVNRPVPKQQVRRPVRRAPIMTPEVLRKLPLAELCKRVPTVTLYTDWPRHDTHFLEAKDIRLPQAEAVSFWDKNFPQGKVLHQNQGRKPYIPIELVQIIMEYSVSEGKRPNPALLEVSKMTTEVALELYASEKAFTDGQLTGTRVGEFNRIVYRNLKWAAQRCLDIGKVAAKIQYNVVSIGQYSKLQCFVDTISKDPTLASFVHILHVNLDLETERSLQTAGPNKATIFVKKNGKTVEGYYDSSIVGNAIATILQCCGNLRHLSVNAGGAILGIAGVDCNRSLPRELKSLAMKDQMSHAQSVTSIYRFLSKLPELEHFEISHAGPVRALADYDWPAVNIPRSFVSQFYPMVPKALKKLSLSHSPEITDEHWIGIAPHLPNLESVTFNQCKLLTPAGFLKGLNSLPRYPTEISFAQWQNRYNPELSDPYAAVTTPHICEDWKATLSNPRLQTANLRVTRLCKKFWQNAQWPSLEKLNIRNDGYIECGLVWMQQHKPAHSQAKREWVMEFYNQNRNWEAFPELKGGKARFDYDYDIDFEKVWETRYGKKPE